MKSMQIFTLIVGTICVLIISLLVVALKFPDMAMKLEITDGGFQSLFTMFFIFSILFAISAQQMNKE